MMSRSALVCALRNGESTAYRLANWTPESYMAIAASLDLYGVGDRPAWLDEHKLPTYEAARQGRLRAINGRGRGVLPSIGGREDI